MDVESRRRSQHSHKRRHFAAEQVKAVCQFSDCLNANPSQYFTAVTRRRRDLRANVVCVLEHPQSNPLTSADGRFCACTVPSLHPSRRARFSAPPPLPPHPSHSYWPRLRSTVGPPDTGNKVEIELAAARACQSFSHRVAMETAERQQSARISLFFTHMCHEIIYFLILSGGLTCPTDPFPLSNLSHEHFGFFASSL